MNKSAHSDLPVLLIDDEEHILLSADMTLNSEGITNVEQCQDSRQVMQRLSQQEYAVVVLDINMPYISGHELLPQMIDLYPEIPVVILTGINEVDTAVQCMKTGAFDYLVKPVDENRLVTTVRRAIQYGEVRRENALLKRYLLTDELEHPEAFSEIVTRNSKMHSIFKYMEAISKSSLPVLITGETGVGKELMANAVHVLSECPGDFVAVNVAGLDDNLFADTLFGHKKGAFTGADRDRKGMIEQACNGTLFLDEIGDLRIESQVKLLRLLQDGSYYAVGSDIARLSSARIVVATNHDIESLQAEGNFRKDLYYRLQTHRIHIPPLAERKDDIPLLVEHFLEKAAGLLNRKKPTPPRELFIILENYGFPGNVRELESMIYDAVSRHKGGVLSTGSFREKTGIQHKRAEANKDTAQKQDTGLQFPDQLPTIKEVEASLIDEALKRAYGNQSIAAQMLGLTRRALNNRINRQSHSPK